MGTSPLVPLPTAVCEPLDLEQPIESAQLLKGPPMQVLR